MKTSKLWACLGLVCWLLTHSAVLQSQPPTPYDGLNILFLVDQSGSMGGPEYNSAVSRAATDPLGLRFGAVQYALRTLSQYRLLIPETVPFQMGVVYFGDSAEVGLNWTTIQTDSDTGWAAQQTALLEQLANTGFGTRNLGNTNFIAGFEGVQGMFDRLPVGTHPLNVIIVLTDGAPCAPTQSDWGDGSCSNFGDKTYHMEQVEALTAASFPPPDYRIHVIALDADNGYWPDFESYWQAVSRDQAVRAETPTQVGQYFLDILASVVKSIQPADGGSVTGSTALGEPVIAENGRAEVRVPPYHQLLRLNVFKSDPAQTIQAMGPDNTPINTTTPGVTIIGQEAAIEIWTVANPIPGRWTLTMPEGTDLVDVYLDLLTVNHDLALSNPPYVQSQPIDVLLQLTDADGQALPTYPDNAYPLEVTAVLHPASGPDETMLLPDLGQNRYSAKLLPNQAGAYTLDIRATTTDVDGTPLTILDLTDAAEFEVQPITLTVEGFPQQNLLMSEAITISAQLMSGTDPVTPAGMAFKMIIQDQAGSVWADVPLLAREDGRFGEQVVMRDPGQYRVTVKAVSTDAGGAEVVIAEQSSGLFTVDPADLLLLSIEAPTDKSQQNALEGTFPLVFTYAPPDVLVRVKVIKETDGQAVNLSELTPESDVLTVTLTETLTGKVYPPDQPLRMTDTGLYEAVYKNLPEGDYLVESKVRTDVELEGATLFAPRTQTLSATFQRVQNPAWAASLALTGLIVLLVVGSIVFFVVRTARRRRHPINASLGIMYNDEEGNLDLRLPISLRSYRSNTVVISKKQLRSLPESLQIQRLVVRSLNDRMSQRGEIEVNVYKKGKSETHRLTSSRAQLIGRTPDGVSYYLQKDYDKDND